jgi:AraC-like DNA-binding protein
LQEGRSVTEIAFLLGYSELSTFARAFKRWTGKAPSEYAATHGRLADP